MATEAHEILNLIRLASSRPPSPSPSTSGAHSNTLPSAPPEPTTTSVRAKTTDYSIPLKGASRANTIPSRIQSTSSQTHTDVIKEIRTSSTFIQQKLHEVDLKLININKSIHNSKRNTCSFCSTFKVVLLLIILGIIVYYIFFKN